jgi:hypothetical protein
MSFIDGTRISQNDGSLRVGGPQQLFASLTVYGALNVPSATVNGKLTVGNNFSVDASGNIIGNAATFNALVLCAGGISGTGAAFENNLTVGGQLTATSYSVANPVGGSPLPGASGNVYYSTSSFAYATFQNGLLVALT